MASSKLYLAKLDQLFHAASFLAANIRYFSSSSSDPRGQGVPVRSQGENILLPVRLCRGVGHLCSVMLLCGGIQVPCADKSEKHVKFSEISQLLLEPLCETPKRKKVFWWIKWLQCYTTYYIRKCTLIDTDSHINLSQRQEEHSTNAAIAVSQCKM